MGPLVAEMLGLFPEHASWLVPAIDAAIGPGPDEDVRKALTESKARLTGERGDDLPPSYPVS